MLYADFPILMKKGDRLPVPVFDLVSPDPTQDFSGATAVLKFELADGSGSPISGSCTVVSTAAGRLRVSYAWGASDTAVAGRYNAEFVVTVGGGEI
jgi:hypothetical protein